ncbi:uncharacterized protein LAESUDRAFT_687022 [Laetiporus sulphureus 93-53]|uniref:Large ribosomal subunit protein mL59 domain-containing protein n=1 Tax=Laetiporus sulphureus 93-53 TaxID=1314785 RepID=A0A165BKW2_9APHY|nr:uncharacterized protein LAESUDRAFT_687022 [Laetiporus sulphureus 93-53]KZT01240.1 hypothetical protein LAESUDRAFT_687022 [Laetiporus sulphureus 93-53]
MAALQAIKQFRKRELASLLASSSVSSSAPFKAPNPFLPHKNPDTGRWAPAKYSLRRQVELVKHARDSNTLHLLPPGPKLAPKMIAAAVEAQALRSEWESALRNESWAKDVDWEGEFKEKEVPGADVGNTLYAGRWRMFKGHKHERMKPKRQETTKRLMAGMEARIERFRSTYRRKTPSPLSPIRNSSYTKLPF